MELKLLNKIKVSIWALLGSQVPEERYLFITWESSNIASGWKNEYKKGHILRL